MKYVIHTSELKTRTPKFLLRGLDRFIQSKHFLCFRTLLSYHSIHLFHPKCLSGVKVSISLFSFFFLWCPSVPVVSFNSCRVLNAYSHTLTPHSSLSHQRVNRPDFHSSLQKSPIIRLVPAMSMFVIYSPSLSSSLSLPLSFSAANKSNQ